MSKRSQNSSFAFDILVIAVDPCISRSFDIVIN